ncbi:hypothetical protein JNM05_03265 [bacterium]|nr:hypothetical protein [bacterium]
MTVVLRKEQIRFLFRIQGITISAHDAVDIVTFRQDDLKMTRGGVIALGIFGLASWISESVQTDSTNNKYRIGCLH